MSNAIEWSLGLPCPDQRDAILASVVEGPHAPTNVAAAAADHLRRCPACRAFRDSLRTQRVLVRRVAEQQQEEKKKRERQRQLRGEMTEWVEQELKVRGERELARLLWRLGTALLRFDPSVARQVFTETRTGAVDESSIASLLTDAIAGLAMDAPRPHREHNSDSRVQQELVTLRDALSGSASTDLQARVEVIHALADLAEVISPSICNPIRLLRANVEWYHGNESLVPRFLGQAFDASADPEQRAHALANLALWHSSRGSFDAAIELGSETARSRERIASTRVNVAVWTTMLGDRRSADRGFAEAAAIVGPRQFRVYWPWSLVVEWLNRCLLITAASPREQTRAIDSMWVAYHRWGGLPSSIVTRKSTSQSESSP